jgi:hypothetical protein
MVGTKWRGAKQEVQQFFPCLKGHRVRNPSRQLTRIFGRRARAPLISSSQAFTGIVLTCRVIGVLQIEQSKGKAERNDRLFPVPRGVLLTLAAALTAPLVSPPCACYLDRVSRSAGHGELVMDFGVDRFRRHEHRTAPAATWEDVRHWRTAGETARAPPCISLRRDCIPSRT